METFALGRYAVSLGVAAALLGGCGGSQSSLGALDSRPESYAIAAQPRQTRTWMLPEAKGENLLYVTDSAIDVFSYPSGTPVGSIADPFAHSVCSDQRGNIFVVDPSYARVTEYSHGALIPIAILRVNSEPVYCAVDPNTNSLAVTTGGTKSFSTVAIFTNEKGHPKYYNYDKYGGFLEQCSFDNHSNLLMRAEGGQHGLAELPKGAQAVESITLKGTYKGTELSAVQWDGKYLTIADEGYDLETIDRLVVKGATAKIVGQTILKQAATAQTAFYRGNVIAGAYANTGVWKYPSGGSPIKTIYGTSGGLALSLAAEK
jgi:hypothetical protein